MTTLSLTIYGEPKPKQSARFSVQNGRIHKYQSAKVKANESDVRSQVMEQLPPHFQPIAGGIAVKKLWYIFAPLKSFKKAEIKQIYNGEYLPKTTKPDLTDNLQKGLFDALQGILFLNDSQIHSMDSVRKVYGAVPRIELEIEYE